MRIQAGGDQHRDMGDRITSAIAETLAKERGDDIGLLPLTSCAVDAISKTLFVTGQRWSTFTR